MLSLVFNYGYPIAATNIITQWANGEDESVTVNQRALIDKILARYSGEFTVFRELLQNSDDAQATEVEIHFRSKDLQPDAYQDPTSLPDLNKIMVRLVYCCGGPPT